LSNARIFTQLPYKVLDSTPDIFKDTNNATELGVQTQLSTSTSVCERLQKFQSLVRRLVDVDDREAMENTYGELYEAYQDGWDSGSDVYDD